MYFNYNHNELSKYWVLDIEANGLKPTKIWVVVVRNCLTGEVLVFKEPGEFINWYNSDYILVGHNILSFDIPVLNGLWSTGISLETNIVDTLVLSYLYNPAIDGGHSLDAWGQRLGSPKTHFNDWSKFSEEMLHYCKNDVELTYKLWKALTERMKQRGFSELSAKIEHQIRVIIDEQRSNGFWFNRLGAIDLRKHLLERQSGLTREIQTLFPPRRKEIARYKFRTTKDGRPHASYERHVEKYGHSEIEFNSDGTYSCFEYIEFNIGSPKQRVERLLELGWEPLEFTKKGFPKVDEDALVKFSEQSGRKEIAAIAEWIVLQGRASMVETWLANLGDDSRIHGEVFSCGASTRRMTHSSPNTANIPSGSKAKYGHECRALWGVEPGGDRVLVGYDAAGLETAGLCHYLNNPSATEALLREKPNDIHTANARRLTEALRRPIDREWGAKTSWYAWLYGAYPKKLGQIVKGPPSDGDIVIDTFFRNVPGLKALIEGVRWEWKGNRGLLRTIDGGFVLCPSENAALNYLIQSMGAILMKLAAIILDKEAKSRGIPFKLVGSIHDEGQLETHKDYGDQLGKLAVWSIEEAGRQLKLNVPVTGDYKIGTSWDQTH